ncbi:MAG: PD-(D/E)XK nuclease family protein [candidate division Zixibacteria bacterium]|jgi:RecB family exonuclease|nr:PD-(D/E)XK nuclease family protein [candidate division Zixibacteria bacterium]
MLKRYSHSAIATFRTCPRQFKFKYIEKPDVARRVTADAYMGNAVHRALKQLYSAVGMGRVLPLEQVLAVYDAEWEKPEKRQITVVKESVTVDDYIATGRKMLTRYYTSNHPFDQGTTLATERTITFDLPGSTHRMTAIIDRLWRRPDGMIEICDYKTGDHLPQGPRDRVFFFQMGIYQLAVQQTWPDFRDIELVQYFLKMDEKITHRMSEEDLDVLQTELKNAIAETIHAERRDEFPTTEGGHCGYCEFFDLCPAKRHRLILEKESGEKEGSEVSTAESAARLVERYLDVHERLREIKSEADALKVDLARAAGDLGVNKLVGGTGEVSVKVSRKEKFVTKTGDEQGWADFGAVVRQLHLDDYLVPDANGIYRDIYKKGLLPDEDLQKLAAFIIEKEEITVRAKLKNAEDEDDSESA